LLKVTVIPITSPVLYVPSAFVDETPVTVGATVSA
jgi:hypothetical protein